MDDPLCSLAEQSLLSSDPTEPLPPYAFVPGGRWPHPNSSPRGHSFGRTAPKIDLAGRAEGSSLTEFRRGVELFNAGYYWEAHEVWEGLWHAYGRKGAVADVVKAFIKLAAAGVKVREGQEHGVRTHAGRAAKLFASARKQAGPHQLGLDLDQWTERWRPHQVAADPSLSIPAHHARARPVVRDFAFQIEIKQSDE